jgi:Dickkopf-like protein
MDQPSIETTFYALRPRRWTVPALLFSLAAFAIACSSSSSSLDAAGEDAGPGLEAGASEAGSSDGTPNGGGDAGVGTPAELCEARFRALCNAWSMCPTPGTYFPTLFASVDDCVRIGQARCEGYLALAADGLPSSIEERRQNFALCTQAMARAPVCRAFADYLAQTNEHVDPECAPRAGLLPEGSSCFFPDQCQSRLCLLNNSLCGTCSSIKHDGEACQVPQECELGSTCSSSRCTKILPLDSACTATTACAPELACLGGRCAARLEENAACAVGTNPCRLGYCNRGHCQSFELDGVAGGPCGSDPVDGVVTACAVGSTCDVFTQSFQGLCVDRAEDGDRCFFAQGFQGGQCEPFSACVNGVCTRGPVTDCARDGGPSPERRDGGIAPPIDAGAGLIREVDRLGTLFCDAIFACPRYAGLRESWFGSCPLCESIIAANTGLNLLAPKARATETQVMACNDALSAIPDCERVDRLLGNARKLPACELSGAAAPGDVCTADAECGAGSICSRGVFAASSFCGICESLQSTAGVCITSRDCAQGLACAQGHCVAAGQSTAMCTAAMPCDFDLACVSGVCAEPPGIGAPCNPRAPVCASPLFCSPTRSVCEVPIVAGTSTTSGADAGVGADASTAGDASVSPDSGVLACGIINGSITLCERGSSCKLINARTVTGTCSPAHGLGEACAWTGGLDGRGACDFPAVCVDRICQFGDHTYCE